MRLLIVLDGERPKVEKKNDEAKALAIRFDRDESALSKPVPWAAVKDEPAFNVGDRILTVDEGMRLARDAGQYIAGMGNFMRWVMELTGMAQPQVAGERVNEKDCPRCSRPNPEYANYCLGCGERLGQVVEARYEVDRLEERPDA